MKLFFAVIFLILPIYLFSLATVPVHLNQDELGFALNAHSIAKTGFDENGRFFPLYFWHLGVMWSTPIIVYLTALFLSVLPLSESIIRLPSVFAGLVNLVLIFLIAKKIFNSHKLALLAMVLLATTPAHFIHSRILLDNLFIVPFVLGWFYILLLFREKEKPVFLFLSAFMLGAGIHSYHAAKVVMPIFFLVTLSVTFCNWRKNLLLLPAAIAGFILPILPLIPWLSQYPDTLTDQVRYAGLYDIRLTPIEGVLTLLKTEVVLERASIWIKYFDPSFLFVTGDLSPIHSTQKTGVFLAPLATLIPLGIWQIFRRNTGWLGILIVLCLLIPPFAPALVGNQYRISKALAMLPFAVLLAAYGFQYILFSAKKIRIFAGGVLYLAIVAQFVYFLSDYFTDYRTRFYGWFNYNIPDAMEAVIEDYSPSNESLIYLDNKIPFAERYWQFFTKKHNRKDLQQVAVFFDSKTQHPQFFAPGSLAIYRFDSPSNYPDHLILTKYIPEPDKTISFYLYRLVQN